MTLKMAVFAPMPSVSVNTTMAVKPGRFINVRIANRVSCQKVSMKPVPRRVSALLLHLLEPSKATTSCVVSFFGI